MNPRHALAGSLQSPRWLGFVMAFVPVLLVSAGGVLAVPHFALTNLAMPYLLGVVGVAVRYGIAPAVLCAVASVAAFDLLFVPPRFSFAVHDAEYLVTFVVMLAVGLVAAHLAARLHDEAARATARERDTATLYLAAERLAGAFAPAQVAETVQHVLHEQLGARAQLWQSNANEAPTAIGGALPPACVPSRALDLALESEAPFDWADPPALERDLRVQPLRVAGRLRGILVVELPPRAAHDGARDLVAAMGLLVATALERLHFVDVAQSASVEMARERLRNTILSVLSHDIRTPLTVLVGLTDSLSASPLAGADATRKTLASLREQALSLNEFANDLIDMARLQSGASLRREWESIQEIVGAAVASLDARLSSHLLELDVPSDLPLVECDAVLASRLVANLLDNAQRYTPAGSTIRVCAYVTPGQMHLRVADNGPGLPAGGSQALFEPFARGQREGGPSGLGLGLAICRAVAELHGGRVEALPNSPQGCIFEWVMPRREMPVIEAETQEGAA
ncbi:DUF4118 domain-containing protein [Niveibacterium sp. 24ML]|uniref:DUF4118 domain-containing protein n=1 Tax=Niveibacterium sp. 24ML TaxID=2985512 RepID=UPI00226D7632|nr:DUF4118 domain-containing protein [Niveibacterium sp. 24ML]MCX9155220.1 DUF4118 domain-containing protein [Niveibacterium sp. 24ML]